MSGVPEAWSSNPDLLTTYHLDRWLLEPSRGVPTSGWARPSPPRQSPARSRLLPLSCPRPHQATVRARHGRTCPHQLLQQAAPLAAEDVGTREAAIPANDTQVGDTTLDQVVGRCQASRPCGEGLAAGAANDGATLRDEMGALANRVAEGPVRHGGPHRMEREESRGFPGNQGRSPPLAPLPTRRTRKLSTR